MTPPPTDRLAIARAAYNAVPLYDPKRAPIELDLTDNTNLWGLPPTAERTMREIAVSSVTRYPTLYAAELKEELAKYVGVTADMIVTGCGSYPRRCLIAYQHSLQYLSMKASRKIRFRIPSYSPIPQYCCHLPP